MMRIRTGFIGNLLGIGVRNQLTPWTTLSGYIQIWAYIESDDRNKSNPNYPDVRQGYAKLEGPWGAFTAGRQRTLISRGATDINVLYAHRWGVGFPNIVDRKGPTQGMVGFGVLGSGFAAGMIYGTPSFGGLQLNVGIFDPAAVVGPGWTGTKWVRPEAELTFTERSVRPESSSSSPMGPPEGLQARHVCSRSEQPLRGDRRRGGLWWPVRAGSGPSGRRGTLRQGSGVELRTREQLRAGDADTRLRWSTATTCRPGRGWEDRLL